MNRSRSRLVVLAALMTVSVLVYACSDDEPTTPPVVVPSLTALSDSIVQPGDTLYVLGTGFSDVASENRIRFNNDLARPPAFRVAAGSLCVVVPANATSGALTVIAKGVASGNSRTVQIERGVGDVWIVGEGASLSFKGEVPLASAEYLIVPHTANTSSGTFLYDLAVNNSSTFPLSVTSTSPASPLDAQQRLEIETRNAMLGYIRERGGDKRLARVDASSAQVAAMADFLVFTGGSNLIAANFTTVTANLEYEGRRALVYADVDNPTDGAFTTADYMEFGVQFDNEIFPTDSAAFAAPTDIDGNGKVVILFTQEVNKFTETGAPDGVVAGFFLLNDLVPGIAPGGTSNAREIFYSLVPDNAGVINGNRFTKDFVKGLAPSTLAHEFEHMISFGHRVVVLGKGTNLNYIQDLWLEEGMAHVAEDLNVFPDQNIARGKLYRDAPGATPLLGEDSLEQRGGIFLFLRYLGDRYGDDIFRSIVQSTCVGTSCIEAITGESFHFTFAYFLATLYLHGTGITSDPRFEYTTIDLGDYGPLSVRNVLAGTALPTGSVRGTAGDFWVIKGLSPPALDVGVTSPASAAMRVLAVRIK